MDWTEDGWVCELELKESEPVECKFVIVRKDKRRAWESGDNRVLMLPEGGSFKTVFRWDRTGEGVEFLPLYLEKEEEGGVGATGNGSAVADDVADTEIVASPLVEQWQGKVVSFVRSKEQLNIEKERKWDISGLEGIALKWVEGDKNSRNWWRKVRHWQIALS